MPHDVGSLWILLEPAQKDGKAVYERGYVVDDSGWMPSLQDAMEQPLMPGGSCYRFQEGLVPGGLFSTAAYGDDELRFLYLVQDFQGDRVLLIGIEPARTLEIELEQLLTDIRRSADLFRMYWRKVVLQLEACGRWSCREGL